MFSAEDGGDPLGVLVGQAMICHGAMSPLRPPSGMEKYFLPCAIAACALVNSSRVASMSAADRRLKRSAASRTASAGELPSCKSFFSRAAWIPILRGRLAHATRDLYKAE